MAKKHYVRLNIPEGVTELTGAQYQALINGQKIDFPEEVTEDEEKPKRRKYNNRIIENEHGKFDSQKEYDVFLELKLLEDKGIIKNLVHKFKFDLLPTIRTKDKTYRKITYEADFIYEFEGEKRVVDVKGWDEKKQKYIYTKVYRIKKHLMLHIHNIEIIER